METIFGNNDYWIRGDIVERSENGNTVKVYVLSNTNTTPVYSTILLTCSAAWKAQNPYDRVELDSEGFSVPNDCHLRLVSENLYFTKLVIDGGGKVSSNTGAVQLISSEGSTLDIVRNGISGSLSAENVDINCTCNTYDINGPSKKQLMSGTFHLVAMGMGLGPEMLVANEVQLDGIIELSDEFSFQAKIKFTDKLEMIFHDTGYGDLWPITYVDPGSNGSWSLYLNAMLNGSFIFEADSITMTGDINGDLRFANDGCPKVPDIIMIDLEIIMTKVDLSDLEGGNLYIGSESGVAVFEGKGNIFILPDDAITKNMIKSASEDPVTIMLKYRLASDPEDKEIPFEQIIDESGDTGVLLALVADEKVHISGQSTLFVKTGESIDLSKIEVTCDDGYVFAGWYCIDEKGNLKQITELKFVPTESMQIFAFATPDSPAPPSPSSDSPNITWLIVVIACICIVAILIISVSIAAGYRR